jgi:chromosome partitioning protein
LALLHTRYGKLVTDPIRVNVRLSEAPAVGRTIYEHDPRSRGAMDYAQLVEHVAELFHLRPTVTPASSTANVFGTSRGTSGGAAQPADAHTRSPRHASVNESPLFHGPTHEPCPACQQPLQQAVLAGYRVRYCDHCHYKRQELIQGARR